LGPVAQPDERMAMARTTLVFFWIDDMKLLQCGVRINA
jgi:hypothetical protein